MKPWRDLTDSEKIERLGSVVAMLQKRMERVDPPVPIPGYEMLNIDMTMEGFDDWLPLYGGHLSEKKAHA